ncbi:beta-phosphoglucomutase family hydrolase [Cryobacterium psychrophilum]|uniref:Beta-phosphoglucomutase family hydrolase n=1 Tax=Cryobacterium psychrophilum TaxID=41988 RepID=A0A4Y8KJ84_9MICO|nr:beta-phosphoglucomutase family hydrolase [Cryobacterium psychrophilum]
MRSDPVLYDAVIFDLDGVVTDTAAVHARAWQTLFDEVLPALAGGAGHPFDPKDDYLRYVDGRPREDGIRTFLASRGIQLLEDGPTGPGAPHTVAGLAARKQTIFDAILAAEGVVVFEDALALARRLRGLHIATAIATSSRNSVQILEAAGATGAFDVCVDGTDAIRLVMPGKPNPALFLEAARRLGVTPARAAVLEDAVAGVEAAQRGGFGLIVGVDRTGSTDRLRAAGADIVLADLGQLDLAARRENRNPWLLRYDGFDPAAEGVREALCTLGNGFWGTRGAAPERDADEVHYPGTYLAGVYNRLSSVIDNETREDEHMVNAPNWLPLHFRVAGGEWLHPGSADLNGYWQELDLKRATLTRYMSFRDRSGRTTSVTSRRFVSQTAPHVAVLETTFEAVNWSGVLEIRSALDGRVANRNVAADRSLDGQHLVARGARGVGDETILLEVETSQSGIHISLAARTRVFEGGRRREPRRDTVIEHGWVAHAFDLDVHRGRPVRVEKLVVVSTSRDRAIASPTTAVLTWLERLPEPADLRAAHEREWHVLWKEFAVRLDSGQRSSLALNLNTFHVLQTVAAVDADLDAGVPARGLHGEGYRGHVFWDEMFVYPVLTLRRPDLSLAMLGYRYRRLGEARAAARQLGHAGAMFPWQSGIDGREVTPNALFNPRTGQWMPDHSHRQRHVGLAIAYSVWQYYQSTGDIGFLIHQGAELLIEVARFFSDLAILDEGADRYDVSGVMGPDEFHDGPPGNPGAGLRNNTYTNVMVAWTLSRAVETVALLRTHHCTPLWNRLRLHPEEVDRWDRIRRRLRVVFHADGILSQFDGYEALPEFEWEAYRARYGSLGRLDLILNAEGDSTNNYRLAKQADVLMLLYLFSAEELRGLLHDMGYAFPPETVVRTVDFYRARSTHGSTLSSVVHSWVEARRDRAQSWNFLLQALECDLGDVQTGSTHEGIHLGAMAGSVDMIVRCYTGLEIRNDMLWLHPALPDELGSVDFMINYREQPLRLHLTPGTLRLHLLPGGVTPIRVRVEGQKATLSPGQTRSFALG